jgi:hypothetical protein
MRATDSNSKPTISVNSQDADISFVSILFVVNDTMNKYQEYQATGVMNQVNRRAVKIELTTDQIKKLGIKDYETIESISENGC